jgi:hypothetical protein
MTLKSALEDLSATTLRAVDGCLHKLEYIAGLRRERGDYSHWGFSKLHGEVTARRALESAHKSAISQVLSTPLRGLLQDVQESSEVAGMNTESYLEGLTEKEEQLLPKNPGAGSARHLRSVLHALLGLERSRDRERSATRRAS